MHVTIQKLRAWPQKSMSRSTHYISYALIANATKLALIIFIFGIDLSGGICLMLLNFFFFILLVLIAGTSTLGSRFLRFWTALNNVNGEINNTRNFSPFGIQTWY